MNVKKKIKKIEEKKKKEKKKKKKIHKQWPTLAW